MVSSQTCRITIEQRENKDTFTTTRALIDYLSCNELSDAKVYIDNIVSVPDYLFSGEEGISSATFGEGVVRIGVGSFLGCKNLKSLAFDDGIVEIGESAFTRCFNLTSFDGVQSLRRIGDGAFFGCKSLSAVSLNRGLLYIGRQAFAYCPNLTDVNIQCDKQCVIENNAFHGSLSSYCLRSAIAKKFKRSGDITHIAPYKERIGLKARDKEKERLSTIKNEKNKNFQK